MYMYGKGIITCVCWKDWRAWEQGYSEICDCFIDLKLNLLHTTVCSRSCYSQYVGKKWSWRSGCGSRGIATPTIWKWLQNEDQTTVSISLLLHQGSGKCSVVLHFANCYPRKYGLTNKQKGSGLNNSLFSYWSILNADSDSNLRVQSVVLLLPPPHPPPKDITRNFKMSSLVPRLPDLFNVYRIAGNFGEVFVLANWRFYGKFPN